MAKFCNKCGAQLADEAVFCPKCGASQAPAQTVPGPAPVFTAPAPTYAAPAPARKRPKPGPIGDFFSGDYSRYSPIVLFLIIGGFFFGMLNIVKAAATSLVSNMINYSGSLSAGFSSFTFFSAANTSKKVLNVYLNGSRGGFGSYSGYGNYGDNNYYQLNQVKSILNGYTVLQVFYTIFMIFMILATAWLIFKMVIKKVRKYDFYIVGGASFCWFVMSLVTVISISNIDKKLDRVFSGQMMGYGFGISTFGSVKPTFAGIFSIILIFISVGACVLPIFTKETKKLN